MSLKLDPRFWEACNRDCVAEARQLIEAEDSPGVCVHKGGTAGRNPLHIACRFNCPRVVRYLIDHGADVTDSGPGSTPLNVACEQKCLDVIGCLVQHGADVNTTSQTVDAPLHVACKEVGRLENAPDLVVFLVQQGADVNAMSADGKTLLSIITTGCPQYHGPSLQRAKEVTKLLITHGADVNATDKNGVTTLHLACNVGQVSIALLLLQNGANVHMTDQNGFSPFHYLLCSGGVTLTPGADLALIIRLLEYGANPEVKSAQGYIPFQLCNHAVSRVSPSWPRVFLYGLWAGISGKTENDVSLIKELLARAVTWNGVLHEEITSTDDLQFILILFATVPLLPLSHHGVLKEYINSCPVRPPYDRSKFSFFVRDGVKDLLYQWLETQAKSFPTLKCLCRAAIRNHLGASLLPRLRQFYKGADLPKTLILYIYLYDEAKYTFPQYSDDVEEFFVRNANVH